jgi:KipI family sensor histidine kinase inhibitor
VPVALEPFGDAAWRVRLPETPDGRAVLDALRALPGVVDAVVCERHALVVFDPRAPPAGVADAVDRALSGPARPAAPREHTIRARYDGPDLAELGARAGVAPREIAALHAGGTYVVAAVGFLPGFAYLRGLHPRLVAPRRASPRARVPACSIAIAGPYTGVYPFSSAGGWNLVGTAVDFAPFDARAGASLGLGDRVRFEAVVP